MSSNLYNKVLKDMKFKTSTGKVKYSESEMSASLRSSFNVEFNSIMKSIEFKKLQRVILYEFLSKYVNNVPRSFYYSNVMKLGHQLIKYGYFEIANNECFERYLTSEIGIDVNTLCEDVERCVQTCVSSERSRLDLTVEALFGVCRSQIGAIVAIDPLIASEGNRRRCQRLLQAYQAAMEAVLPREDFCWLLYNGTVYIYETCQRLIGTQRAAMAVEPLIWACCCLETSIPLLTALNLKWRATLYTAVCQALYNSGYDADAERFARRGLAKINELNAVYEMSSESLTVENSLIITEATIKMGVMIFKRAVFEIRRRPKTYLRPKTKVNFKELLQTTWPRTGTERLLVEMFESPSQQALAIAESIKQPQRPLGKIGTPTAENDWDIQDVYSELFYAFTAIVTGRSSSLIKGTKGFIQEFRVTDSKTGEDQLSLAVKGLNEVTVETVFDMVCWAFTYDNGEFMDVTIDPLSTFLKENISRKTSESMLCTLKLMTLMRKAVHSFKVDKKTVKLVELGNDEDKVKGLDVGDAVRSNLGSVSSMSKDTKSSKSKREEAGDEADERLKTEQRGSKDPLYDLAEYINIIISNTNLNIALFSKEILIEAGSILWSKCKLTFHSTQDGSLFNHGVLNIPSLGKWTYILSVAHRLFSFTNYAELNPVAYAELSIRLACLLEDMSLAEGFQFEKSDTGNDSSEMSVAELLDSLNLGPISKPERCLIFASDILKRSLTEMDKCRAQYSMNGIGSDSNDEELICRSNSLNDIYLELNLLYFRVTIRGSLVHLCVCKEDRMSLADVKAMEVYKQCLTFTNKNLNLKALFYGCLCRLMNEFIQTPDSIELANMTRSTLEKIKDNLTVTKSFKTNPESILKLPPPVVVERGSSFITLKVDETYISEELKKKIGCVRLYGRAVDTPNAEVRLTDDKLSGTGVQTSSMQTQFVVRDLVPNEQYIFAFAAFDKSGEMIGRGIGHSTKKVLATDKINTIYTYALIAQMFFEIGLQNEVIRYVSELWTHFMEPVQEPKTTYKSSPKPQHLLHQKYNVKPEVLNTTSFMLLRQFCLLVMSSTDCRAQLNHIRVEPSPSSKRHLKDQIMRLDMCSNLVAVFPISKKLKNHLLTMELFATIVQLTIPLMNHNQFYQPFVEILLSSLNTLHNLPQTTWIKISSSFKTDIHHMIASVGFYLLKYYNRYEVSSSEIEVVRSTSTLLLQMSSDIPFTISEQEDTTNHSNLTSRQENGKNQKTSVQTKKNIVRANKGDGSWFANLSSHQIAFEAYKYTMGTIGGTDNTLTGSDEPDILLAYIANLPSKTAYKEVIKFTRKTRYLQFVVEVAHKAMVEGNLEQSLSIYKDIREWLRKRNENILARSVQPPPSQMNTDPKRNDGIDVGSLQDQSIGEEEAGNQKRHQKLKKKTKYKTPNSSSGNTAITVTANMNEVQKQRQEELELKALSTLASIFPTFYKQSVRKRRFRQVSEYEMPSRIRLNSSIAMSYLGIAQGKMDSLIQMLSAGYQLSEISEMEDVSKYMFNNTGRVLPLSDLRGPENKSDILKITKSPKGQMNDRPRTFRPDMKFQEKRMILEAPKLLSQYVENISKTANLLKKAIVLSERSQNWLLLSRACAQCWYALTIVLNMSFKFEKFINEAKIEYPDIEWSSIQPTSLSEIFKIFVDPFHFGSDALMDLVEAFKCESSILNFDQNFIENFILRSLHLLYDSRKYQKFIHVTLRFTRISNYNYVNATHPLLIECQEALINMSKTCEEQDPNWTVALSKQHISQVLNELQWVEINTSNYGELLKKRMLGDIGQVNLSKRRLSLIQRKENFGNEPAHVKNLISALIHTGKRNSGFVFSVPVDVEVSLREWSQNSVTQDDKRLWIEMFQRRTLYSYQQNLSSVTDGSPITFGSLARSYKELIDFLKSQDKIELSALLERDLGDLCMNDGRQPSLALQLWNESLEDLLNQKEPLEHLNKLLNVQKGYIRETEPLVTKFGVLKSMEIGGVLSRIIRYGDFSADRRTILCIYAATFFKTIYGSSLAHSDGDLAYLENYWSLDHVNPAPLLIRSHILSDPSKNDIQDIESHLWYLITELHQAGYNAFVLPLMALYEHIVCTYFRNSIKCTRVRILKLEVAIQLKQFGVASRALFQMLSGDRMPQLLDSQLSQGISKKVFFSFNDNKGMLDDNNLMIIDKVLSRRLSANIAQRIGPFLVNKISILQAKFILKLAESIIASPKSMDMKSGVSSEKRTMSKKSTSKKPEAVSGQTEDVESILELVSSKMQWETYKQISLPQLKGLMLQVASGIIQPIIEDLLIQIQKENPHAWRMTHCDALNVINGLLVQARICREQNYNRCGARLAMFACKILEEVALNDESGSSAVDQIRDERALGIGLHIRCNQELVMCLLGEVGIGQILDSSAAYIADVPDLKAVILSNISQCDENSLYKEKAWFVAALARFALNSGFEAEKYHSILKESVEILEKETILNEETRYLYIECRCEMSNYFRTTTEVADIQISSTHDYILNALDHIYPQSVLWNTEDPSLSRAQICNVYEDLYEQLSRIKLLLAAESLERLKQTRESDQRVLQTRLRALTILNTGLDITRAVASRKPWVEIELLMMIGRIQRYLLTYQRVTTVTSISTFVEGLKLSISSSGHLGIQKQFFFELALAFMFSSQLCKPSFGNTGEIVSSADFLKIPKSKGNDGNTEANKYRNLSWLALKCADNINACIRQIGLVKSDSSRLLSTEIVHKLPILISFDLFGRFLLGNRRIIFKSEIEEELSRMPESRIPRDSEHIDDQLERIRQSAPVLNWSQLLTYQEMLIKVTNNSFLSLSSQNVSNLTSVTRRICASEALFIKEFEVHRFMMAESLDYGDKCQPFIPNEMLQFVNVNTLEGMDTIDPDQGSPNGSNPLGDIARLRYEYQVDVLDDIKKIENHPLERADMNEIEFSIQMYNPPFEFSLQTEGKTLLLYYCSKKVPKSANKFDAVTTGWRIVPSSQFFEIHETLQEIAHLLEVLSSSSSDTQQPTKASEGSKKSSSTTSAKPGKAPSAQVTLAPGAEISDIEIKIRTVIDSIRSWREDGENPAVFTPPKQSITKVGPNSHCVGDSPVTLTTIPFDLSAENIRALASLFHPFSPRALVNNLMVTKFVLDCLKIVFL